MMVAKILRRAAFLALAAATAAPLAAQQAASPQVPQPKIYAVQPCGAKIGAGVEIRISSGSDLDGADRLIFSHPGITAKPLEVFVAIRPVALFLHAIDFQRARHVYDPHLQRAPAFANPLLIVWRDGPQFVRLDVFEWPRLEQRRDLGSLCGSIL